MGKYCPLKMLYKLVQIPILPVLLMGVYSLLGVRLKRRYIDTELLSLFFLCSRLSCVFFILLDFLVNVLQEVSDRFWLLPAALLASVLAFDVRVKFVQIIHLLSV